MQLSTTTSAPHSAKSGTDSSEYVYVIMTAITAGLSIFGGSAICVLYFAFKDMRSPGRQLLLYVAFSDAMLALGNLLGIIWYLYSDSEVINRSEAFCDFQSAMTIYFSITSFSWTVTIAVCLFASVVLAKTQFTSRYMKLFHVISWLPGVVITAVAWGMGVLGTDTSLETASWCWIDPRTPHTLLWQFVTGKFMEIVAYITTVVLYTVLKIFLQKQAKKKMTMVARKKSRKNTIEEANRKLTFVPLVFIVCRIWGTLRFLIGNFGQSIVNEPYVTWINPLQGIGDSAQGIANFVLYCYSTESIRKRMLKPFGCYNRVDDVTMADVTDTAATVKAVDKSVSVAPTNSTVLCDSVRKLKRGSQSSILSNETKNKQNAVDDEMPTSSVMIDPKKLTYDLNTADNANTSRSIIQDSISLTINVGNQPKAKAGVDPCTAVNEKNENGSSKLTINHSDCREIRNETLAPVETPEIEGQHSSLACNVVGEVNFSGDVSVLSNGKVFPVQPTSTNGNSE